MRFLLHLTKRNVNSSLSSPKKHPSTSHVNTSSVSLKDSNNVVVEGKSSENEQYLAFGQQCSDNCGCVIRFESIVDEKTDKITSCSYTTKKVIFSQDSSTSSSSPVVLNTRGSTSKKNGNNCKVLMKECSCNTLNTLGKITSQYLTNKKFHELRNMTEFEGTRSSKSFRYTVLSNLFHNFASTDKSKFKITKLNEIGKDQTKRLMRESRDSFIRQSGKCFDIAEEALMAMARGYMPTPRRIGIPSIEVFSSGYNDVSTNISSADDEYDNQIAEISSYPSSAYPYFNYDDQDTESNSESSLFSSFLSPNVMTKTVERPVNKKDNDDWLEWLDSQHQQQQ